MMHRKGFVFYIIGVWATAVFMANSAPLMAQIEPTSTPDAEGIIYDLVRTGDTMYEIAYRNGITLEAFLTFNNLSETDFIYAGDTLIVGIVTPEATATVAILPTITPTRPPPTPMDTAVPPPPTQICLLAFVDENTNGRFDPNEALQTAVAITIFTPQSVIANYITDGRSEPYCTDNLPAGEYQITRSILPSETLTSSGNRTIILQMGDVVNLQFGGIIGDVVSTPNALILETAVIPISTPTPNTVGAGDPPQTPLPSSSTPATQNRTRLIAILLVIIGGLLVGSVVIFIIRLREA